MNLILTLCILFVKLCYSDVPADQKQALVDFYNSAGGTKWSKSKNWLDGDPCDNNWDWVHCRDGKIHELNFNGANVDGTLPESFGNFVDLEFLEIEWQKPGLTGIIPESMGNLKSLILWTMVDNQLTGSLPKSIGNLKNLQILHLGGNNITGLPSSIKDLESISGLGGSFAVEGNNINTPLPPVGPPVAMSEHCGDCALGGNPIPEPIPDWATRCCRLGK